MQKLYCFQKKHHNTVYEGGPVKTHEEDYSSIMYCIIIWQEIKKIKNDVAIGL